MPRNQVKQNRSSVMVSGIQVRGEYSRGPCTQANASQNVKAPNPSLLHLLPLHVWAAFLVTVSCSKVGSDTSMHAEGNMEVSTMLLDLPGILLASCSSTAPSMDLPRKSKLCRPDCGAMVVSRSQLQCSRSCPSRASNT